MTGPHSPIHLPTPSPASHQTALQSRTEASLPTHTPLSILNGTPTWRDGPYARLTRRVASPAGHPSAFPACLQRPSPVPGNIPRHLPLQGKASLSHPMSPTGPPQPPGGGTPTFALLQSSISSLFPEDPLSTLCSKIPTPARA